MVHGMSFHETLEIQGRTKRSDSLNVSKTDRYIFRNKIESTFNQKPSAAVVVVANLKQNYWISALWIYKLVRFPLNTLKADSRPHIHEESTCTTIPGIVLTRI